MGIGEINEFEVKIMNCLFHFFSYSQILNIIPFLPQASIQPLNNDLW